MHPCTRVVFSLGFHLGKMTLPEGVDFLVGKVGHEWENAMAEVKVTERAFHDAVLREGILPVELVRAAITDQKVGRDFAPGWQVVGDLPAAEWPKR